MYRIRYTSRLNRRTTGLLPHAMKLAPATRLVTALNTECQYVTFSVEREERGLAAGVTEFVRRLWQKIKKPADKPAGK